MDTDLETNILFEFEDHLKVLQFLTFCGKISHILGAEYFND